MWLRDPSVKVTGNTAFSEDILRLPPYQTGQPAVVGVQVRGGTKLRTVNTKLITACTESTVNTAVPS